MSALSPSDQRAQIVLIPCSPSTDIIEVLLKKQVNREGEKGRPLRAQDRSHWAVFPRPPYGCT